MNDIKEQLDISKMSLDERRLVAQIIMNIQSSQFGYVETYLKEEITKKFFKSVFSENCDLKQFISSIKNAKLDIDTEFIESLNVKFSDKDLPATTTIDTFGHTIWICAGDVKNWEKKWVEEDSIKAREERWSKLLRAKLNSVKNYNDLSIKVFAAFTKDKGNSKAFHIMKSVKELMDEQEAQKTIKRLIGMNHLKMVSVTRKSDFPTSFKIMKEMCEAHNVDIESKLVPEKMVKSILFKEDNHPVFRLNKMALMNTLIVMEEFPEIKRRVEEIMPIFKEYGDDTRENIDIVKYEEVKFIFSELDVSVGELTLDNTWYFSLNTSEKNDKERLVALEDTLKEFIFDVVPHNKKRNKSVINEMFYNCLKRVEVVEDESWMLENIELLEKSPRPRIGKF